MFELRVDGNGQAVTTILTYCDTVGSLFVALARTDPRYKDVDGKCLDGVLLPVGPCRFIGGMVENGENREFRAVAARLRGLIEASSSPLDIALVAAALRELREESGLNIQKYISTDGFVRLVETLPHGDQEIHYLNLHLGTLTDAQISELQEDMRPADDLIQIIHLKTSSLKLDEAGQILINPEEGSVHTKIDFNGFPEMKAWNEQCEEAVSLASQAGDHHHVAELLRKRAAYNRMHNEITGLQGIDESTLAPSQPIGMFDPGVAGVKTDGDILAGLLRTHYGISLQPPDRPVARKRTLVIASRNKGKLAEYQSYAAGYFVEIIDLAELEDRLNLPKGKLGNVEEDGITYVENAREKVDQAVEEIGKSTHLRNKDRYDVMGDDSGGEVAGATWRPGTSLADGESIRLAGENFPGTDTAQFEKAMGSPEKILAAYEGVANEAREFRAITVIVFYSGESKKSRTYCGEVLGTLAIEPRGEHGFAYDPIVIPDGQPAGQHKTFAEMETEEKNRFSHRGKAFKQMLEENYGRAPGYTLEAMLG